MYCAAADGEAAALSDGAADALSLGAALGADVAAPPPLVQAAASELREHGVHAALLVVDATIESEKTPAHLAGKPEELSTTEEDVARAVDYLASQSPRGWTHELRLTPRGDSWVP